MTDSEKPDYSTLRWVKEGLEESLLSARRALEEYVDAGNVGSGIQDFTSQMHQILGTLRMVQVYGAGMLVEEMEHVGNAIAEGEVTLDERLAEYLMLGLVQLPSYLQRIESGEADIPLVLLPVMNDLRAARNLGSVSQVSLYAPNLDRLIEGEVVTPGSGNPELGSLIRDQRNHYHKGLLAWYRDGNVARGLHEVLDVVQKVNAASGTARLRRLMDAAEALVIVLAEGEFDADEEVKRLFGRIDRVFKQIMDTGEESTVSAFPLELLKNLLYFVSRSISNDPVVLSVKKSADLANSFPENIGASDHGLASADIDAWGAVSGALLEDLGTVKDELDLYIRGDHDELERLTGLDEQLLKIGDTLGIIGRGRLRARLQSGSEQLKSIQLAGEAPSDDTLMEIATDLLAVEAALTSGTKTSEAAAEDEETLIPADAAQDNVIAVVKEAFSEFSQVKDKLEDYLRDTTDRSVLNDIPENLQKLVGVFRVASLDDIADLLTSVRPHISTLTEEDTAELSADQKEALVDVFAGVDYYLESTLERSSGSGLDSILDYSQRALAKLTGEAREETVAEEPDVEPSEEATDAAAEETPPFKEAAFWEEAEEIPALEIEEELAALEPDLETLFEEETSDEEVQPEEQEVVTGAEFTGELAEDLSAEEPVQETTDVVAGGSRIQADEIDPEIFEIFMEEAHDELGVIQDQYPRWRADRSDEQALQTFRRSFHTLKGSGRMVGAFTIGEFAWAFENLINRVIEGAVDADEHLISLMDEALEVLPLLVEGQATGNMPDIDVASIEKRAADLAEGIAVVAEPVLDLEDALAEEDVLAEEEALAEEEITAIEESVAEEEAIALAESVAEEAAIEEEVLAEEAAAELVPEQEETEQTVETEAVEEEPPMADLLEATAVGGLAEEMAEEAIQSPAPILLEDDLYEIFRVESETHLATIDMFLADCRKEKECKVTEELIRSVHTLRGSSHLADVDSMAELAGEMEAFCNSLSRMNRECGGEAGELLGRFHDMVTEILHTINTPGAEMPDWEPLFREIARERDTLQEPELLSEITPPAEEEPTREIWGEAIALEQPAMDPELVEIFLEEAAEISEQLEKDFLAWKEDYRASEAVDGLKRSMHTLKGGARLAGLMSMGDLVHALESVFESLDEGKVEPDSDMREMVRHALDQIAESLDILRQEGRATDLSIITEQLTDLGVAEAPPETTSVSETETAETEAVSEFDDTVESILLPEDAVAASEATAQEELSAEEIAGEPLVDVDSELLEIFLEEAGELSEQLEQAFDGLKDDLIAKEPVDSLLRSLHTFKGGARLAGLASVGDLSHMTETLFEALMSGDVKPSNKLRPLIRRALDSLAQSVDQLQSHHSLPPLGAIISALEAASKGKKWAKIEFEQAPQKAAEQEPDESILSQSQWEDKESEYTMEREDSALITDSQLLTDSELLGESQLRTAAATEESKILTFPGTGEKRLGTGVRRRPPPMQDEADDATGKGERVRVLSGLLDDLVNNAGEVSIYRARLEQQNNTVAHNLSELTDTVGRLRAQMRALEIETEAQVLSRHEREQDGDQYTDFDPLEMDRYSTMQQLSRALSETINDLANLAETLDELARDTDTLLLQQARITTDLQDGLLRTRMVPFKRQASRLERVVRQTSSGVGKKAELFVQGAEGEIDRTILNRIMGPLEHLLRNAVAHGIEVPQERREKEKPETGKVSLILGREGTDVVITISDDGRGLDAEQIRQKAISRGMMEPDARVEEDDLYQFILEPGFSTAVEVTQIAGRGVGMDAVVSEVKQLGGSLEIESQLGRGSSFIIRLPFTLAITEALLVKIEDEVFAVPHGNAEIIMRVTREDLLECYTGRRSGIEYNGKEYPIRYLGSMLGLAEPTLPSGVRWFPVLLVRSGEHRVAIQVDHLLGNYQIVVKSVGTQLSAVRWFTGGTILADGRIALIVDLNALVRTDIAQQVQVQERAEDEAEEGVTIMVVDDSITVRKVTTRLLERHNMRVITAKDGVDAVTVLQDHKPDLMLLDIEMPRMDGYELARHIRHTPELKDIPIIMITSRTGEKHRQRAMDLGVNQYLGKPFQEADLLDNIYTLLAEDTDE